jgi:serine/threonine protein kinase
MDQLVGQVLDNTYRIDKILGQGGMGAVFLGRDVALNREVAIKLMHPHIAQQEGFRERFLQEARAIAALEHTGIVPIYTFSRDPQRLYIAMAFLQGQNLRDWLQLLSERRMVISLAESLAITELLADALAYAHRRGVFHRDIKPGNIILRPLDAGQTTTSGLSYQPVLTDFGLAKLAEGGIHSMSGMAMGTPAYMAPEQCEGLEIDGRADIYALGVVLYEMVTGRVPFSVRTLTEAIRAHTKEPPPPPRSINPNLPSQVEEVILKAMAKRPQDRYATADLFGQACAALRRALPREEATLASTQAGQVSLVTMMSSWGPMAPRALCRWPAGSASASGATHPAMWPCPARASRASTPRSRRMARISMSPT